MLNGLFSLGKEEFVSRRNALIGLMRDYAGSLDFRDAFGDRVNKPIDMCLRHMLYGFVSSEDGKLFYMAYAKPEYVKFQLSLREVVSKRRGPFYRKMRDLYSRDYKAEVYVLMDDLSKSDARAFEKILRDCVEEYGLKEVTFPGFEQLSPVYHKQALAYDGMVKDISIIKSDVDFDMARAVESRMDIISTDKVIADRIDRQVFWTNVMENKEAKYQDRLKASELLGRSEGDFVERVYADVDLSIKNILDVVRSRRETYECNGSSASKDESGREPAEIYSDPEAR